jgi:cell division protein FtsB
MVDRSEQPPTDDADPGPPVVVLDVPPAADAFEEPQGPDLDTLPVVGITRRRVAFVLATIVTAWIVIVFTRQVGEAATAAARAERAAAENAVLAADLVSLERELERIQLQPYIRQQARAYGLGKDREVPFTLAPDAPPLAGDAPGSSAQRLGGETDRPTPLERWLGVLFGPASEA